MGTVYSVRQLLALDDQALVQHMLQHRDVEGRIDITHVKDWDDTSEAEQIELRERFSSVSAHVQLARPIDFEHLLAKLVNIDAERELSSRKPMPSSSSSSSPSSQLPVRLPTPLPEVDASKGYEIDCYHELVDAGGRPPVALDLLDTIYKDYTSYAEKLEPWLEGSVCLSADDLGVFSRPLARWKAFQRWQRNNRCEAGSTGQTLMVFRQQKRRDYESMGLAQLTTVPDFEETIRRMWEHEQVRRQREHDNIREAAVGNFKAYADSARCRLRAHGFTGDFELLEDPQQQDQRLTWIEYLEFEYWWLDKRAESVRAAQQQHDRAWEKIVVSGILRPGETRETLLVSDGLFTADGKMLHASHSTTQKGSRGALISHLMRTAQKCVDARAAETHQLRLVQWALTQMPREAKAPSTKPLKKGNKRRRQEEEDADDNNAVDRPMKHPTTKRQRQRQREGDKQDKGGTARQRAEPQTRLTLGLMRPVKDTRIRNDQGHRRSARIRNLAAQPP